MPKYTHPPFQHLPMPFLRPNQPARTKPSLEPCFLPKGLGNLSKSYTRICRPSNSILDSRMPSYYWPPIRCFNEKGIMTQRSVVSRRPFTSDIHQKVQAILSY
ncbi:hypothetical protein M405DRAFT_209003 [Rhizopogon salebrosus TDB-379]|nr:hypothetical protein M405DRAFT_209003 [Rhizopogon salebrosus TDB-379]